MSKKRIGTKMGLCLVALTVMLTGCNVDEVLSEKQLDRVWQWKEILQSKLSEEQTWKNKEDRKDGENGQDRQSEQTGQSEEEKEEQEDFLFQEASCYNYEQLNEWQKLWYEDIADTLNSFGEEVRLNKEGLNQGMDETDIDAIFQCVLLDHPELFYVEGYTYTKYSRGDYIVSIRFSGTYNMDREQAVKRKHEIEAVVQPILNQGKQLPGDYEKIKYVYETIIQNTDYDLNAADNQNIYSVFVRHRSVCQGYAKAVQYLLERLQIPCTLVQGTVDTGEGHAWNLVEADGEFYYLDATWGDASYQSEEVLGEQEVPEINYDYLNVTTDQLMRTHIMDQPVEMPVCTATEDNYYVREGTLFDSYDREKMQQVFDRAFSSGKKDVSLKCTDRETFRTILHAMIEEKEIFQFLPQNHDTIVYSHNEKQLSMSFWVTNE